MKERQAYAVVSSTNTIYTLGREQVTVRQYYENTLILKGEYRKTKVTNRFIAEQGLQPSVMVVPDTRSEIEPQPVSKWFFKKKTA